MQAEWQMPRNALAWLLLAQFAVVLPHISRLPAWVTLSYIVCVFWRGMVFYGRWGYVSRPMKVLLMMLSVAGVFFSYRSLLGLEPSVALLLIGFSFKLIEARSRRDTLVLIFLAYFVVLAEFLFEQSMLVSLYQLFAVVLVSASLLALHQPFYAHFSLSALKKSLIIFSQAVPLMIVLFVVFPRFDPLWQVPLPSHQAKTGMSDFLSPGDISNLTKNDDLAFRVRFEGGVPRALALYWRGVVLSDFDGRRWSRRDTDAVDFGSGSMGGKRDVLRYTVIQEPTYQPWLFSLRYAQSPTEKVISTTDFNLRYKDDVYERIAYRVTSAPQANIGVQLSARDYRVETTLNGETNPRARQYAEQLYDDVESNKAYVHKVLDSFNKEPYFYTLTPPLLGDNGVDEFLFDTRRGFCGHYASSFVFLMRSVGVPARVVTGYLGGEVNPLTGVMLVYQFDAHAWAEVWLEGEGWVRFDPTAYIAPERVESSIQNSRAGSDVFSARSPLSPLRFRHISWINKLRLRWDAAEYYWASWVLQYRDDKQLNFISRMLGEVSAGRLITLFLSVIALVVLWVFWDLFRSMLLSTIPVERRLYRRLCRPLGKLGFQRLEGEGAIDFSRRVTSSDPVLSAVAKQNFLSATRLFVSLCYEQANKQKRILLLKQFRREVNVFVNSCEK